MSDNLTTVNQRYTRARVHIEDATEFVENVILNRDEHEYPDPYLREVSDAELLQQYLKRIYTAINSYTAIDEESETIKEFYQRERERINAQIGRLTVPHPSEHGIDESIIGQLEMNNYRTGYGFSRREMPWELYEDLFNKVSLRDLRILSAYLTAKTRNANSNSNGYRKNVRVVNAIRYVRGDETVSLRNILQFIPIEEMKERMCVEVDGEEVELEEGVPFEEIESELATLLEHFDTMEVALALANIGRVTNYHNPKISNGRYNNTKMNISHRIDKKTGGTERNVIAHELFHSLQDIIGTLDICTLGDAVELDASPDEWSPIGFPPVDRHEESQVTVKELWFKLRNGQIEPLCEYQTKNINEMFAVAFEAFIENPQVLEEKQPEVYNYINTLFD